MKEIHELNFPNELNYSEDHEWVVSNQDTVKIGITDYAQNQLGDIVFVELPAVGATVAKGDEFGTVESVKAVSELYMPIGGKVIAINENLEETPELVNTTPYGDGWMIEVAPSDPSELDTLKTKDAYLELLKGLEQ